MLAPFCEGESAPASVVALGRRALDWWAARVPGVVREGTLVVAPPRDASEIERFAVRTAEHVRADEERIAELEPDLAGRFRKGLFFAGEGHLDPRVALPALAKALRAHGGEICFGVDGETPGKRLGTRMPSSTAAAGPRGADLTDLRGVRGEMVRIHTRRGGQELTRTRAPSPSSHSALCRAARRRRVHDRRDDDRKRGARRHLGAVGAGIAQRGLCAASGFWRGRDF